MQLYWSVLKAYSIHQIRIAGEQILKHRTEWTFPKPADFIEAMQGGDTETVALVAFKNLERLMEILGHYKSFKFEDPAMAWAVERCGGWLRITSHNYEGHLNDFNYQQFKRDFMRLYSHARERGLEPESMVAIGFHDANNLTFNKQKQLTDESDKDKLACRGRSEMEND